jgi:hypothetical protein
LAHHRARRVAHISDLSREALRCHAFGHPWDDPPAVPFYWWGRIPATLSLFRCPSCGSTRRDVRDRDDAGRLLTRLYSHADDYLVDSPARQVDYIREWFGRYKLPPDDLGGPWQTWSAA